MDVESLPHQLLQWGMPDTVQRHYETYPYPRYPLLASLHREDSYALNLDALWARFNGTLPPTGRKRILIAGCGSFAPYPFSIATPHAEIIALDLSRRSLNRARLHCLLHGRRNVSFQCGDLLDPALAPGPFHLIDAYGVLHHLNEPLQGFKALAARLTEGGIMRVMVYSRYARREEESIRRALRLLGVRDTSTLRRLMARSRPGSRLRRFSQTSPEASFEAGLADALLHPCVHTFRINQLLDLLEQSSLRPLLFAHHGALEPVDGEVERLRCMEARHDSPGNFVVYAGRVTTPPCSGSGCSLLLNPCLTGAVSPLRLTAPRIQGRLGHPTPHLGRGERAFLRRFRTPVKRDSLSPGERRAADVYTKALFLLQYRG
jgi:SAM-dependent methyltransferase